MNMHISMIGVPKGAILKVKGEPGYYKVFRRDFKRNKIHLRKIVSEKLDTCLQ